MPVVGKLDASLAQRDALHDEARQALVDVGFACRQAFEQAGKLVAAVLVEREVEHRRLQPDFGEGPRAVDDAAQLEINQQPLESQQRPAIGVGKCEIVDLEAKQQRIEAYLADADRVAELRRHLLLELPLDDRRQGEEAAEQVHREESHADERRLAGDDASQPVGLG